MALTNIIFSFFVRDSSDAKAAADAIPTGVVAVDGLPVADVPTIVPSSGTGRYTATLLIDVVAGQTVTITLDASVSGSPWWDEAYVHVAPANAEKLAIDSDGSIEHVILVDTTTTNADMRGTNGANTVTPATTADVTAARDAVINRGDSAWITSTFAAADVWSYFVAATGDAATDKVAAAASQITVTVPKRAAQQSLTPTRNLEQKSATQWTYAVEELGELPAGNAIYFTLKTALTDADSAAILQVRFPLDEETGDIGLIVLNGADPGAGRRDDAAIVYETYVDGAITYGRVIVTVEGEATAGVATGTYVWDIKSVGESDMELDAGSVQVKRPVTMAT